MASALNAARTRNSHTRREPRAKCGGLPTWLAMPAPADIDKGNRRARFSRAVAIALVLSIALWAGLAAVLFSLV